MLSSEDFIKFILSDVEVRVSSPKSLSAAALPEGFEGFDSDEVPPPPSEQGPSSFARRLLEASGFGYAELVQRDSVIRSSDAVAKYLPDRASYWPKTATRPYQTLLFITTLKSSELLRIPAFRNTELRHLNDLEAALARLVSEALDGFQRGGEGVTADVRKGRKDETLCIISITDEREDLPAQLVCFGTWNKGSEGGLETFQITEQARRWEPQLAREHLALLYARQFKRLAGADWQDAFTTTEERKQAEKLLEVCTRENPVERDIQESILDLLDMVAKGFGLRKKPNEKRRLQAFALPVDHDIGIDPEEREDKLGGANPFGGVTLRDYRNRLLGYIVYPMKTKSDADRLKEHLSAYNRFHNVLVVFPDANQASLELWQGHEPLEGKLRQGQGYRDAANVVNLLSRFFVVSKAKVGSPTELAQELAYRARYLRRLAMKELAEETDEGPLRSLYNEFKAALIHNQTEEAFADAFAQTLTYSLLTARWIAGGQVGVETERFTRRAAHQHLQHSHFLSELFASALSAPLDERRGGLLWLVDDIADLLDRIDVASVFNPDGSDLNADPIIHFYEPFLKEYDAKIRMQRGVYYTPRSVVSYIVRTVHKSLQNEFGLADGLADTATWGEMSERHTGLKIPKGLKPTDRFVTILDPATGTGTFLVETIEVIHGTLVEKWKREGHGDKKILDLWNDYVPKHLLPRLYGYELLMAPYAIAHLKVGLKLHEAGYQFRSEARPRIYVTNTLDPAHDFAGRFKFAIPALAHEADAVNDVKRHQRFTVVIGNPPYSNLSANLTTVDRCLVDKYKFIGGERIIERNALQLERNLNDDYVKFIAWSEELVKKSGIGILSMISNSVYTSSPSLRGMRAHLLDTFQSIRILDLHGASQRGLASARAQGDENVFDIEQSVAVGTFISGVSGMSVTPSSVQYTQIVGSRASKYALLAECELAALPVHPIVPTPPGFRFISSQTDNEDEYLSFIPLPSICPLFAEGIKTGRDWLVIDFEPESVLERMTQIRESKEGDDALCERIGLSRKKAWNFTNARGALRQHDLSAHLERINYRPFDIRIVFYHPNWISSASVPVMRNLTGSAPSDKPSLQRKNIAILAGRISRDQTSRLYWCSQELTDKGILSTLDNASVFPALCYPKTQEGALNLGPRAPEPNLSQSFSRLVADRLGLPRPTSNADALVQWTFDIFTYLYALLWSPAYRERYGPLISADFPRLPLTSRVGLFRELASLGGELAAFHLGEAPAQQTLSARYDKVAGAWRYEVAKGQALPIVLSFNGREKPIVSKVSWSEDTVWIESVKPSKGAVDANAAGTVGFSGVPEDIWNFQIGGYQVCEKWLKDRKDRILTADDIAHYHRIVMALHETIRIMKKIDEVINAHDGWPAAFATALGGET